MLREAGRRNRAPRIRIPVARRLGLALPALFLLTAIFTLTSAKVLAQPNSSFSLSIRGLQLSATAVDGRAGLSYSWSFGDGASKSGRSTSHKYGAPGDYTVTLRVTDSSSRTSISYEDITVRRSGSNGKSKKKTHDDQPRYRPAPQTCQTIAISAIKVMTQGAGAQCQIVDGTAGIGNQGVIDAGPLFAVDVWGDVGAATQVCFEQSGSITLLDASTAPRRAIALAVYETDGWTCAQLTGPGTAVLLPGDPVVVDEPPASVSRGIFVPPDIWDDESPLVALDDCRVRTRVFTRFRQAPGGDSYGSTVIRYGMTFTASARTDHWFYIEYDGKLGWISAHLVRTAGDCDPPIASEAGETGEG